MYALIRIIAPACHRLTFRRVVGRAEAEMPLAEAVGGVSGPLPHGAQQIPRQRDSDRMVLAEPPLQY